MCNPKAYTRMCLILTFMMCIITSTAQPTKKVILDADTGNEVDDAYAIARLLIDPEVEVLALNATQWQASHWAVSQSMEESYRINKMLLGNIPNGHKIPCLRGGVNRMFDWGYKAQHSQASYSILKTVEQLKNEEKLDVLVLGALTNIASAVYIKPEIAPKIRVYWLGTGMDFTNETLKTTDFNCVMDIQAVDVLFNSEVEMHIMPHDSALPLKFNFAETKAKLRNTSLGHFLTDRWKDHKDGARSDRTLWDLAIVAAYLNPDWFESVTINISRENNKRVIHFYKPINGERVRNDFFEAYAAYEKRGTKKK